VQAWPFAQGAAKLKVPGWCCRFGGARAYLTRVALNSQKIPQAREFDDILSR